jgi:DNA polymerase elongation subunit (family B)
MTSASASNSIEFRLLDFQVYNQVVEDVESLDSNDESSHTEYQERKDNKRFIIQMYGLDESGKTYCVFVEDFNPYFYIRVNDNWTKKDKEEFQKHLEFKLGNYYKDSLVKCSLIKRKELYGFDDNKKYKFLLLVFKNMQALNKVKNMFYINRVIKENNIPVLDENGKVKKERKLHPSGYVFNSTNLRLYEANIPPLLRYFHIREISPTGWVKINNEDLNEHEENETTCDYEYTVSSKKIISLSDKETKVPYKICSFDIEASSSHGDFPVPIKNYKKLATNILDYWLMNKEDIEEDIENIDNLKERIRYIIHCAFGYHEDMNIDLVYPKKGIPDVSILNDKIDELLTRPVYKIKDEVKNLVMDMFNNEEDDDIDDNFDVKVSYKNRKKVKLDKTSTIIELLNNDKIGRDDKLEHITHVLDALFPKLKGDKVTFIGSTFMKYGDKDPYLNHCIALDTCSDVKGSVIEQYDTEKEVLLAWTKLIQRENPDIIIGYNIFGFDYTFMFNRAKENGIHCVEEFLKLSRNQDEICGTIDKKGNYNIEETSITIASGTHNLSYIKMNGRIQIDLYNYFRREFNLTSYKLDYVSGYFIGDNVKSLDYDGEGEGQTTMIKSKNLTGLNEGNYIHFEEIGHSSEYYDNGNKFQVINVNENTGEFTVNKKVAPDMTKKVKWCLAKDDVNHQDIFRLTNEGPDERAIIAKYCIQDCNLVHYLLNKIDIITGLIEMGNICTVPLDFLIMRGQGIKLFSFVSKQCRLTDTLIPVLEKKDDGGYEGAIVLPPKSGLYLDEPVACVDYSSLYPSSMISENISHDSKVWAKEYDLDGNLINEVGIKDGDGNFIYDNLPGYKYVNINYDTYEYRRKTPKSAAVKTKVGSKMCRFAQFPDGELGIIPQILKDLLAARKATRTQAKFKTIKTSIGDYSGLVIEKSDKTTTLKDIKGNLKIIENVSIQSIEDTYDDFMKNVLDKRQLAIKVTANSVYGQTGARTSSFYEKDVAASTTATGRKLLTYGKRIIEEVYGDRICETQYGKVHSHAEYIYGDSVLGDTPIILKNKSTGNIHIKTIKDMSDISNRGILNEWHEYNEFKPFDTYQSNRKEKQQMKNNITENFQIWTANGWSDIVRLIRHKCNKKIYRVRTYNSVVDVTEDHSLLDKNGKKIKPIECTLGKKLLHNVVNINLNPINIFMKGDTTYSYIASSKKKISMEMLHYYKNTGMLPELSMKGNKFVLKNTRDTINKKRIVSIELLHDKYNDFVYDIETHDGTFNTGFPMIVKNTDSVFMSFKLTDPETGEKIVGKEALKHTIELAKEAGELATKFLKAPHDLEYEKTFMPFCLLSKKRYVGMLYEEDPDKCYRKSMGIVLKRRDNAPIVKDVYGGIIDILMKDQNLQKAIDFTKQCLSDIIQEKYPLEKLIITKSLNGFYKNPLQIAHKVLADRMGKRDPGNKPNVGDRIPFVYIQTKGKKVLQGDKVEHPSYIRENKIRPDYSFYITNQIMKPVTQVFSLVLEDIPEYSKKVKLLEKSIRTIKRKYKDDEDKQKAQEQKLRDGEIKKLIFEKSLKKCENIKNNQKEISVYFSKK